MPEIQYSGAVGFNSMHGSFGFQQQPNLVVTDYLNNFPAYNDNNTGLIYDPATDCSYQQVISVPYDQAYASGPTIVDSGNNLLWASGGTTGSGGSSGTSTQSLLATWNLSGSQNGFATLNGHAYKLAPWGNEYAVFQSTASNGENLTATQNLTANSLWDGYGEQGYDLYLSKYLYSPLNSTNNTSYWSAMFYFSDLLTGYGIEAIGSGTVNIIYTNNGGATTQSLRSQVSSSTPIGEIAGNTLPSSADLLTHIRVVAMNDSISIRINDGIPFATPVVIETVQTPPSNTSYAPDYQTVKFPVFYQVVLNFQNFSTCAFAGWPVKFLASSTFESARYSLGFIPQNQPTFDVKTINGTFQIPNGGTVDLSTNSLNPNRTSSTGNPPSSMVNVAISAGSFAPDPQFTLQIQMPSVGTWNGLTYSNHTVQLSGVSIRYDGIYSPPDNGDYLGYYWLPLNQNNEYTPKAVSLHENFNLNSLCVSRTASATFDNWYGVQNFANNTGVLGQGNIAMAVQMGYIGDSSSNYNRFDGYADTFEYNNPGPGESTIAIHGTDRMRQLEQSFIIDPPNLDNYYHYYAIRYLAESAGIPSLQCKFFTYDSNGDYISIIPPDDPFTPATNDPDPWGLPIGTAGRPWTPIQRQLSVLELMEFIRKTAGCVLFFDTDGYLNYGPWVPPNILTLPYRIFNEYPGPVTNPSTDLTECWHLSIKTSTYNTKTGVKILSIDPIRPQDFGNVTLAMDPNNWQVVAPPGMQPYNYVGFPKIATITDPRFGYKDFRVRAATNLFNIMGQPDLTVQFTTWMQPDLFALGVIRVNDQRSIVNGVNLIITDHQITLNANNPTPMSTITANYYAVLDSAINPTGIYNGGSQ